MGVIKPTHAEGDTQRRYTRPPRPTTLENTGSSEELHTPLNNSVRVLTRPELSTCRQSRVW